jgi:hypothetical protein
MLPGSDCVSWLLYSRTNERRQPNPPDEWRPQSLRHGRGVLCPYARGHSSGTGKCADWSCHHAWNEKSQIRPNKASSTTLLAARDGACLEQCVMSGRVNWSQISSRKRMRRQGVEDVQGKTPLDVKLPKVRRKLSKAELREQAAAAFLAWRQSRTTEAAGATRKKTNSQSG